jgi:dihydrofolate synthase/folylpolyglutamate synthase
LFRYWDAFPDKREYHPTYFELLFFIGMVCFAKENTEFLLLETGLGGRLDATNIIENPALCVITKVGYDHMEYLGDTLEKIAAEKAGIIKPGTPVVYWKEKEGVDRVIEEKAKSLSCPCISVSKELVDLHFFGDKRIDFSYNTRYYGYVRFSVSTKAVYQTENAALAIAAAEQVLGKDMLQPIQKGIAAMHWAGRMEEVLPEVYVDGAHNEDGIRAFLETVSQDGCDHRRKLFFSVVSDKDYEAMLGKIAGSGLFEEIVLARLENYRGASIEVMEQSLKRISDVRLVCFERVQEALTAVLANKKEEERIYIVGSLYLVGEIKEYLSHD